MKRITKIEAAPAVKKKIRVAAYVRVSTSMEDQLISLKAQKSHYENYIKSNPDWDFAGIYVDRGISGTKMDKREALLDLLDDCERGQIDRVITKSISRFARNTTDCLMMVRRLTALGVFILFEKENIDTEHMDSELLLSIMSSLAESESRSISENAKWSINRRMKKGTYKIGTPAYGYKNENGQLVVVPEEAALVKEIFQMSIDGYGCQKISNILNDRGIPTKRNKRWHHATIGAMLRNEVYTGDLLMQKTYTDQSFKARINYGEKDMYLIKDHHEAIISHEDFERANQLMHERGKDSAFLQVDRSQNGKATFSKKLVCGECGRIMSKAKKRAGGEYHTAWICKNSEKQPHTCSQRYIKEDMVEYAFIRMMLKLQACHEQVLIPFIKGLKGSDDAEKIQQFEALEEKLEKTGKQMKVLEQLMFTGRLEQEVFQTEKAYLAQQTAELAAKMAELRSSIGGNLKHLEAAESLLEQVSRRQPITEFGGEMFSEHVEKVTVLSRDRLVFHLKCGLNLEERMKQE